MYHQAMPLRQPMTGPRLSTNLQRQMPGCGGSFFSYVIGVFPLFFLLIALIQNFTTQPGNTESHWLPQAFYKTVLAGGRAVAGMVFKWLFVAFRGFFQSRFRNFHYTACQLAGPLCSPQAVHKSALGGCRAAAGMVFMLFIVFRRFLFLDHVFGTFITQPGSSEGPWQLPGSPENRLGRLPGCGGNGFHVVIRCLSSPFFLSTFS